MILLSYPCFFGQFQDKFEEKLAVYNDKQGLVKKVVESLGQTGVEEPAKPQRDVSML